MPKYYALTYTQITPSKSYPIPDSVYRYSLDVDLDFYKTLQEAKNNVHNTNYGIIAFDFDLEKGLVKKLLEIHTPTIFDYKLKWLTRKIAAENITPGAINRITEKVQSYIKTCGSLNKVLTKNPIPNIFKPPKASATLVSSCPLIISNSSQSSKTWDQLFCKGLVTATGVATTLAMASGQADPSHSKMIPVSKQNGYDQSIASTVGLVVLGVTALCATLYGLYKCSQRRNKDTTHLHSPNTNKLSNKPMR